MINDSTLTQLVSQYEKRLLEIEKELSNCPPGRIAHDTHSGVPRLVHETYDSTGRHRTKLSNNPDKISALIRKYIFSEEEKYLKEKLRLVEAVEKRIVDVNLDSIVEKLKKNPCITDELILNALRAGDPTDWANQPFEQLDWMIEEKRHITSRGLKVRSKSEILIAERLYANNIQFRYEEIIHCGKTRVAPDFTIKKSNGSIWYWEHEGLTSADAYLKRQKQKHETYALLGIVPWKNLIVTYDNENGDIDLRIIESEIINKLL
ncbi:MAG: hypothetical protein MJ150_03795 [Clostridia bacterium]|nr:hypothetical protein [Clostridia bacterium]